MDSRIKRDGRALEEVGFYNPMTKEITLKQEQIKLYLGRGAQPTDTVRNIFQKAKLI